MRRVYYENSLDLAEDIYDAWCERHDLSVSLVAKVEKCADVLKYLLYLDIDSANPLLDFGHVDINLFDMEYAVIDIDYDGTLWCQDAYVADGPMFDLESDIVYVDKDLLDDAVNSDCGKNTAFVVLLDEKVEMPEGFSFVYNDKGQTCGFEMEKEGEGRCFSARYSGTNPFSDEDLEILYNFFKEIFDGGK